MEVKPLLFETYLTTIKASVGAEIFKHNFALVDGNKQDILKNGQLSCAFFVSFILNAFNLLPAEGLHTGVDGLVRDLLKSGWQLIDTPRIGAVLVWERIIQTDGEPHQHVGFYLGDDQAISNSSEQGTPAIHHVTYGTKSDGTPERKLIAIYWHDSLQA